MTRTLHIAFVVACALVAGCDTSDEVPSATKTRPRVVESPRTSTHPRLDPELILTDGVSVPLDTLRLDDGLLSAARKALPQEISTNEFTRVLQMGLWNSNRTAVEVSFPGPKASVIFVFLRQTNGTYLAADASGVEGGNLGFLGIARRSDYDRYETTPVQWLHRDDGLFQVKMRTRAWKAGQRYTATERLLIKPDGTVLYR